jgi:hypothetical protein
MGMSFAAEVSSAEDIETFTDEYRLGELVP